ncbi:serine hydrolase domain-containing protein [Spirosoma sp.]|uniref:serine hydrolase domain-containing protein n=1 Tax=Spirosoma sp. TaxID=1899569 RepID=UPI0026186CB3|nr:serine hydrolase domain-containing protein [Spirosoma sp.]MCX6215823.1 serine hydrolase [Spirosoma sp.]
MRNQQFIIYTVLLLSVTLSMTFGQSRFDTLTRALQRVYQRDSLPGLSVVLVNQKKIIYQHSFGYANIEKQIKYNTRSIQTIGSVSKTFAAIALMKAVELGYFDLDTDINTILPFRVVNPNAPNSQITVRQLANHTSGIVDNPSIFYDTYQFDTTLAAYSPVAYAKLKKLGFNQQINDCSLPRFMYDYLSENGQYYTKQNFGSDAPGRSSSYSNIGSALAAYLVEVKSGISYADFTRRYILRPLRMRQSSWFLDVKRLKRYARPYDDHFLSLPYYHQITYPDGGLRTNTSDLGKYLISLLQGYQGGEKLLKRVSYTTMFTPQFSHESPPKGIRLTTRNKGIFWNLYVNGTIGHDGDDPGVSSFLFFNPRTGLGGVFLSNKYIVDKKSLTDLLIHFTDTR